MGELSVGVSDFFTYLILVLLDASSSRGRKVSISEAQIILRVGFLFNDGFE